MELTREKIQRMIAGQPAGAASSAGGGVSIDEVLNQLAGYATQDWVGDNYLSLDFFNSLFRAKTSGGVDVLPNDGDTSTIASIKAMFGFWTDQYISALGNGSGGGGSTGALADLTDVAISNPQNNQVLAYDAATTHWVNMDMPSQYTLPTASASVLGGVKVGSTLDIDSGGVLNMKSGIATAGTFRSVTIDVYGRVTGGSNPTTLAGYGITDAKFGTVSNDVRPITLGSTTQNVLIAHQSLTGLASETWVSQNYVSIAFFNRLFQAYNGSTQVTANDTTTTIDNIKAMVGFWTEQYISALGNGSGGGSSTGALVDLTDVSISNPTDGQALVYDAATTHWKNATVAGSYTLPIATASVLGGIKVGTTLQINSTTGVLDIASGYATQSWVNTQLGSYLPLTGGTVTGQILSNGTGYNRAFVQKRNGYWICELGYAGDYVGILDLYDNNEIKIHLMPYPNFVSYLDVYRLGIGTKTPSYLLDVNGDCRASSFIKSGSDNTYVLQGGGGHSQLKTVNGYSLFGTGDISVGGGAGNYLPLSGGTLTGDVTFNSTAYIKTFLKVETGDTHSLANNMQTSASMCVGEYDDDAMWFGRVGSPVCGWIQCSYKVASLGYYNMSLQPLGGNLGVGTTSPSYRLHVSGDVYATGGVTALSDARHKTIIRDTQLSVEQIAGMPAVVYRWKDGREDKDLHVGSIAQDWQRVLPQVVLTANDAEHTLSMQYGVAALVSAITIARKVVNHEQRLTQLEKECERLRTENEQLKLKVA